MNRLLIRWSRRCGNTLAELMVAVVGASALMVGLSSTIFVAVKATDTDNTPTAAMLEGNAALNQLLSELEFAVTIEERTATAITWTVPDRDGDTNPETIRYAWAGAPGTPLTRQYNGGPVTAVVDNVYDFQNDLPVSATNLLANPGMESGTVSWQAIPGATLQSFSTPVHSGSKTLYAFRNTAKDESGLWQDVASQLTNGQRYDIGAWMRKWSAAAPYDVKILLRVTSSGGGEQVFATDPFAINSSAYQLVRGTVTPTWSGSLLSAYWEATGIANIQDIYVDDAYLRVDQNVEQVVNMSLQVGSNPRSAIQSAVRLLNAPL